MFECNVMRLHCVAQFMEVACTRIIKFMDLVRKATEVSAQIRCKGNFIVRIAYKKFAARFT